MKIEKQIVSILTMCVPTSAFVDDEAFNAAVEPFVPGLSEWPGSDGLPIGKERVLELFRTQRDKARKKREGQAVGVAKAQKAKRLEKHKVAVAALGVSEEVAALAITLAKDNGKLVVVVAEDGSVSFVTEGLRVRGGNQGGGRIPAGKRSGWLSPDGNSILGPVTDWAKETYSEEELREKGCYTPQSDKFRTGTSLAKKLGLEVDPEGRYDTDTNEAPD